MRMPNSRAELAKMRAERLSELDHLDYLVAEVGVWLARLQTAIVELREKNAGRATDHER